MDEREQDDDFLPDLIDDDPDTIICPDCGEQMYYQPEPRGNGQTETVYYCPGCGRTETI